MGYKFDKPKIILLRSDTNNSFNFNKKLEYTLFLIRQIHMKGAKHMLTSYDHLLFLLGVVFYLSKISEIISFNLGVELGQILALTPMV